MREIRALIAARKEIKSDESWIVTFSEEEQLDQKIRIIPIHKITHEILA